MGFLQDLTGWHFLVILLIVILLFGATRLPALSKSLGQSIKIFRGEMKPERSTLADDTADTEMPASKVAPRDKS